MDLSKLQTMLIKHEGLKLRSYVDSVGKLSIGVGRNLTDKGISATEAMALLQDDIADTINFLTLKFPWAAKLDDVRARALTDLTFDLMGSVLEFKEMLAALEVATQGGPPDLVAQAWNRAADELLNSKFAQQAPNRASDLAAMIRTGQDL